MYVHLSIENWGNFFVLDNCEAPLRCIIRAFNSTAAEVLKCKQDGGPSFDNPKRMQRTVYLSDCDRWLSCLMELTHAKIYLTKQWPLRPVIAGIDLEQLSFLTHAGNNYFAELVDNYLGQNT